MGLSDYSDHMTVTILIQAKKNVRDYEIQIFLLIQNEITRIKKCFRSF